MLKVENKSKEEITRIGRKIGEAFAAEKGGKLRQGNTSRGKTDSAVDE